MGFIFARRRRREKVGFPDLLCCFSSSSSTTGYGVVTRTHSDATKVKVNLLRSSFASRCLSRCPTDLLDASRLSEPLFPRLRCIGTGRLQITLRNSRQLHPRRRSVPSQRLSLSHPRSTHRSETTLRGTRPSLPLSLQRWWKIFTSLGEAILFRREQQEEEVDSSSGGRIVVGAVSARWFSQFSLLFFFLF